MENNFVITFLLIVLNIMFGICIFWIRHYIRENDSQHKTLFELFDAMNDRCLEHFKAMAISPPDRKGK